MGFKSIKEHYRIGHIVQIREGRIAIGSPYVSDLIRVSFAGEVTWGSLGASKNDDLARYYAEMTADLGKLKFLIEQPDSFTAAIPVFTYDGAEIVEHKCEALGWPNVTHAGALMYENTFSPDRAKVVEWAKRNEDAGIESCQRRLRELAADVAKVEGWLADHRSNRAKLETA